MTLIKRLLKEDFNLLSFPSKKAEMKRKLSSIFFCSFFLIVKVYHYWKNIRDEMISVDNYTYITKVKNSGYEKFCLRIKKLADTS